MKINECIPYLHVNGAASAIAFYVEAFGAKEHYRLCEPSGRVGHAELDFGGTLVMLADEFPEYGFTGPSAERPTTVTLHLHVDDADAAIERAVAAGARLLRAPTTEFYGERSGRVRDPFGHEWSIGHEVEKVTPEEMQRRYTKLFSPE
jgi:PhnB protein